MVINTNKLSPYIFGQRKLFVVDIANIRISSPAAGFVSQCLHLVIQILLILLLELVLAGLVDDGLRDTAGDTLFLVVVKRGHLLLVCHSHTKLACVLVGR